LLLSARNEGRTTDPPDNRRRSHGASGAAQIIVVEDDADTSMLRSGAQAFLPKPFRVADLLDTVEELLACPQLEGPKEPDPRD
jgi:CheY-like chemotaxis protein